MGVEKMIGEGMGGEEDEVVVEGKMVVKEDEMGE